MKSIFAEVVRQRRSTRTTEHLAMPRWNYAWDQKTGSVHPLNIMAEILRLMKFRGSQSPSGNKIRRDQSC